MKDIIMPEQMAVYLAEYFHLGQKLCTSLDNVEGSVTFDSMNTEMDEHTKAQIERIVKDTTNALRGALQPTVERMNELARLIHLMRPHDTEKLVIPPN